MIIFPAIDLYEGKAVRLYKGDYNQLTVYSDKPWEIAKDFEKQGAKFIHVVDLEGARDGTTPNLEIVKENLQNFLQRDCCFLIYNPQVLQKIKQLQSNMQLKV